MDTRAPSISSSALTLRARHSATVVGNKIYLFGGHGTNSKPYSDLYVMELDNFSWTKYSSDKVRALAYTQTHTRAHTYACAHTYMRMHKGVRPDVETRIPALPYVPRETQTWNSCDTRRRGPSRALVTR